MFSRLSTNGVNTTLFEDRLLFLAIKTPGSTDTIMYFDHTIDHANDALDVMHVPSATSNNAEDTSALPTTAKSICNRAKETYGRAMKLQIWQSIVKFPINNYKLHVRRLTVDGAILIVVPTPLRQLPQTLAH